MLSVELDLSVEFTVYLDKEKDSDYLVGELKDVLNNGKYLLTILNKLYGRGEFEYHISHYVSNVIDYGDCRLCTVETHITGSASADTETTEFLENITYRVSTTSDIECYIYDTVPDGCDADINELDLNLYEDD